MIARNGKIERKHKNTRKYIRKMRKANVQKTALESGAPERNPVNGHATEEGEFNHKPPRRVTRRLRVLNSETPGSKNSCMTIHRKQEIRRQRSRKTEIKKTLTKLKKEESAFDYYEKLNPLIQVFFCLSLVSC